MVAIGLAKITAERSLLGIYREAVAMIRRDERGLGTPVHSFGVPMEQEVEWTSSYPPPPALDRLAPPVTEETAPVSARSDASVGDGVSPRA